MSSFHLRYTLSRRQRLSVEVVPWLPAIAGSIGFTTGIAYIVVNASVWCAPLFLLPPLIYRNMFGFAYDLIVRGGRPTELLIDEYDLEIRIGDEVKVLRLDGIFQVFRTGSIWTVLHYDGTVLTIPVGAITEEQIAYLRSFARRAAATRQ